MNLFQKIRQLSLRMRYPLVEIRVLAVGRVIAFPAYLNGTEQVVGSNNMGYGLTRIGHRDVKLVKTALHSEGARAVGFTSGEYEWDAVERRNYKTTPPRVYLVPGPSTTGLDANSKDELTVLDFPYLMDWSIEFAEVREDTLSVFFTKEKYT